MIWRQNMYIYIFFPEKDEGKMLKIEKTRNGIDVYVYKDVDVLTAILPSITQSFELHKLTFAISFI